MTLTMLLMMGLVKFFIYLKKDKEMISIKIVKSRHERRV